MSFNSRETNLESAIECKPYTSRTALKRLASPVLPTLPKLPIATNYSYLHERVNMAWCAIKLLHKRSYGELLRSALGFFSASTNLARGFPCLGTIDAISTVSAYPHQIAYYPSEPFLPPDSRQIIRMATSAGVIPLIRPA